MIGVDGSQEYGVWTLDDIGLWYVLQLAPIQGGSPGPFDGVISDALTWTVDNVLSPVGATIESVLTTIGKAAWGAVTGALGWILRWVYGLLWGIFSPGLTPDETTWLPSPQFLRSTDPTMMFYFISYLLVNWLKNRVWDVGYWVGDLLLRLPASALGTISGAFGWLRDRVWDVGYWVGDLLLRWGARELGLVGGAFGWLRDRVWDMGYWVGDLLLRLPTPDLGRIFGAFGWLRDRVWDMGYWVGDLLLRLPTPDLGIIHGAFGWLLDQMTVSVSWLWGQVQAAIGAIPGLPSNLLTLIGNLVTDAVAWLWGQVQAAIGAIPGLPSNLLTLIGNLVNDAAGWLWRQLEPRLIEILNAVGTISDIVLGPIADAIISALNAVLGAIVEPTVNLVQHKLSIPLRFARGEYASLDALLADMLDPPADLLKGIGAFLLIPLIGILSIILAFMPALAPINEGMRQEVAKSVRTTLPPIGQLTEMLRRDAITPDNFTETMRRYGYHEKFVFGLLQLADQIPSRADLVEMAVKEAFNPAAIAQFGLAGEFPADFGFWMDRQGYTEDWARKYWIAHWRLPSVEQVFDMFHRGLVDIGTVDLFLKVADYSPPWRDRLRAISYNPLNRVDVRRMYQAGVVGPERVEAVYRALGYSPQDAADLTTYVKLKWPPGGAGPGEDLRALTAGTIKAAYARRLIPRDQAVLRLEDLDFSPDDAELTVSIWDFDFFTDPSQRSALNPQELSRSVVQTAYERRLVDKNLAAAQLEDLGFTPEDANVLLELIDLKLNEQLADLEIDVALNDFQAGIISDADLAARLADIHVPPARVDFLLQRELLRRQAKTARLTRADLRTAFKRGLINETQWRTRLDAAGYGPSDVDIIVALG